jgi:alkylated DNA repair dioxygenase AlkB/SAM-dependent methyltransferase
MEETLVATLTGPHAPWAPSQATPTEGGVVKRKVQHYGYVFDYRTADVLRNRETIESQCPALPAIPQLRINNLNGHPSGPSRHPSEDLVSYSDRCVREGRGWELLAATIERVRHHNFDHPAGVANSHKIRYPHLNQLTVNRYEPGDGIGSHIDTVSAFGDGLISISLNSGIVMEFRRAGTTPGDNGCRKLVYVPRRSLLLMSGPARFEWEHMIVNRMTDTVEGEVIPRQLRLSLTLRTALDLNGNDLPGVVSSEFPPVWGAATDNVEDPGNESLEAPACERDHVHAVYDAIAQQWHHTRGRRGVLWPGATQFLLKLPPGSIVADIGCGDGKYFPAIVEAGSYVIGTDISLPLLRTSIENDLSAEDVTENRRVSEYRKHLRTRPAVVVADCVNVPLRTNSCDAAICIAVLHHLSTDARRLRCLEELVRIVRPGGFINVQAWAMEQDESSRRKFASNDVYVPFNAQPKYLRFDPSSSRPGNEETASPDHRTANDSQDTSDTESLAQAYSRRYNVDYDDRNGLVVFQRYCHLYRKGEIEAFVEQIPGVQLVDNGFESGNHFVILLVL